MLSGRMMRGGPAPRGKSRFTNTPNNSEGLGMASRLQSRFTDGPSGSMMRGRGGGGRGRIGLGGYRPRGSFGGNEIEPPSGYREDPDDEDDEKGPTLSQAIEEAIDFKELRAKEIGVDLEEAAIPELEPLPIDSSRAVAGESSSSEEEVDTSSKADKEAKSKKNQKKRMKKKRSRARKREQLVVLQVKAIEEMKLKGGGADAKVNMYSRGRKIVQAPPPEPEIPRVEIEYVPGETPIETSDPNYQYFAKIFEAFKLSDDLSDVKEELVDESEVKPAEAPKQMELKDDLLEDDDDDERRKAANDDPSRVSKKKWKLMTRPSIADLKASVNRPDVVEWHDVTAKDPKLLVHLKATRNTVPVPRHWCFKRKYLAGKRGVEKPAFELPEFIKKTGIMEMRAALSEKEDQKTMKAKMREKVRPKLGKIDIDYQKLHDAFFRWQTKPYMSLIGNLYFEGRENETKMKDKKPGELSDDLRTALGMPLGPNAGKFPPPWLIAMQRYGPPPSYPNLKVPGLNAVIPEGCSFGYHAGGWGKPPVDESGKPLYGDVFATDSSVPVEAVPEDDVDRTPWGELESESEDESEDEDESDEEEGKEAEGDESGLVTPAEGLITPSGMSSSVTAGMETPDTIELRKKKIQQELEGGETPALFTVLPEKKIDRVAGAFMHSTHVYDINAAVPKKAGDQDAARPSDAGGVEVALNPEELDLADTAAMSAKYEEKLKEQQLGKEDDLSDMVAEHSAKQKRKRKSQGDQKTQKNYKQFKF